MATLRNLKIKTGTCKRILKELHSYEKEVEKEAAKTADMKEKGADPYNLKQQENVLAESRMMVPDCHTRLEASLADLKGILEELKELNQQGPEIEEAQSIIAEVEALFQSSEGYLLDVYEPKRGDPAHSYAATHFRLAMLWDSPLPAADFMLPTGRMRLDGRVNSPHSMGRKSTHFSFPGHGPFVLAPPDEQS